jgi:transposase
MHRLQELVRLHRLQTGYREIARLLQMSPRIERKYRLALEQAGVLQGEPDDLPPLEQLKAIVLEAHPIEPPPQQVSTVTPWADEIEKMLARGARPKAIFDKLSTDKQLSFTGSYHAVKRFCRSHKRQQGISPHDVVIPVQTLPGQIAQVDFGYAGKLYDPQTGRVRKCWFFVMVLGYSRHMFVRLVFDQKSETWLKLHMEAFEHFQGVPTTIVPDNLKAAVIRTAFGPEGQTSLHRSYRELARHYGFKIDPTPPRSPKHKGKVESAVKYVKNNFLLPRDLEDIVQGNSQLDEWVERIAGQRIHGTTGKKPLEQFEQEEREALQALPSTPFELVVWKEATVHKDSHVILDRKLYSVPFQYIGQKVWLRATEGSVVIYANDERVATHSLRGAGLRSTNQTHLPKHRAPWAHRSQEYWEEKAERMGQDVLAFVREVFAQDDVLSQLRTVQSIVSHLETFPPQRAQAACRRASYFGSYSYGAIKKILRKALDQQEWTSAPKENLEQPQFARAIEDFVQ